MKVTDTTSIDRQVVITLDEAESWTLYKILERDQKDDDEKALANALMHSLEVPAAPTTLS